MRAIDKKHKRILYFAPMEIEFQHHGVLGQRWGVITKNTGVNYIPKGTYTKRSLKAAVKGDNTANSTTSKAYDKNFEEFWNATRGTVDWSLRMIRAANIANTLSRGSYALGGAFLGVSLAIEGHTLHTMLKRSRAMKEDNERRGKLKVDPETGFHLKSDNLTEEQDAKLASPITSAGNSISPLVAIYNTGAATVAYEMRCRGYDVRAKAINSAVPSRVFIGSDKPNTVYMASSKSDEMKAYTASNKSAIFDTIKAVKSQPDGSRGIIGLHHAFGSYQGLNYKVNNGEIKFIDPMSGKIFSESTVKGLLSTCYATNLYRTDNRRFNSQITNIIE